METSEFVLKGDFIKLDALLKAAGVVPTGGAAKEAIQAGNVEVDGKKETRRGAKIRGGSVVAAGGRGIRVVADPATSHP